MQGLTKSSPQAQPQKHKNTTTMLTTGSLFLNISFVDTCCHWLAATSSFIACLKQQAGFQETPQTPGTPVMTCDDIQNYFFLEELATQYMRSSCTSGLMGAPSTECLKSLPCLVSEAKAVPVVLNPPTGDEF